MSMLRPPVLIVYRLAEEFINFSQVRSQASNRQDLR